MLNFFRRYQQGILLVVAVLVVISFSFFGTFSVILAAKPQKEDRAVGKLLGGSTLYGQDLEELKRILFADRERATLFGNAVVEREFLQGGLVMSLAEQHFEALKPHLRECLQRMQRFEPYVHPQAPFLSAKSVWSRFAPDIDAHVARLKAQGEEPTLETLSLLVQLYLDQKQLDSELMRRILLYQQSQCSWLAPDPHLAEGDLSLAGLHSLSDWLGPQLVELISRLIFHAAGRAEERGFVVTKEEARADLMHQLSQNEKEGEESSFAQTHEAFLGQCRRYGLEPRRVDALWRRVLLFRRLFHSAEKAVFLDPVAYEQFGQFAAQAVKVRVYELPAHLRLPTFRSLVKLQVYLDAVSAQRTHPLALTDTYLPIDVIQKDYPELVERRVAVEYAEATLDQIARQQVTLKESWRWEVSDEGFAELAKEFPALAARTSHNQEERAHLFDTVAPQLRREIDKSARRKIALQHPEWIDEALKRAPTQRTVLSLRSRGGSFPFQGVRSAQLLEPLLSEEEIPSFTADQQTFYRIRVLQRSASQQLMTFAEAVQDEAFDRLVDRKLEEAYPRVRTADPVPFQQQGSGGAFKPFEEVKDLIGAHLYADLLRALDLSSPLEEAAHRRFLPYLEEAKRALIAQPEDPAWVVAKAADGTDNDLAQQVTLQNQWLLCMRDEEVARASSTSLPCGELLALPDGAWSAVQLGETGNARLFHILSHFQKQIALAEMVGEGQTQLGLEVRRSLCRDLLERAQGL